MVPDANMQPILTPTGYDISKLVKFMTEEHLDDLGGYPHDWAIVGEYLVVADLDGSKERCQTKLRIISLTKAEQWDQRARQLIAEGELALADVYWEAEPDCCDCSEGREP